MPPAPAPLADRPIVLGSTSAYRRELLSRLRLPFTVEPPHVDETPSPGEAPEWPSSFHIPRRNP